MHSVRIDRTKPLAAEPHLGHNRYHPDIAPVVEIGEGEEIALETRDALDGQITPGMAAVELATIEAGAVHPLTGPVFVKGAEPGDSLEIEFTGFVAQPTAFSAIVPGLGFLRDVFAEPFLVHWQLRDGWATSTQIPGVRIPGAPFMGVSAVAPSVAKLAEWTAREQRVIEKGGFAFPPDPAGAVPSGPCGIAGLRTLPPRENGGNFDAKQLTKGAKLFLPVYQPGGLFSTGDGHFVQGDGEVCVTAVEMGATAVVRFRVHKGLAERRNFVAPVFSRQTYFAEPRFAVPEPASSLRALYAVNQAASNRGSIAVHDIDAGHRVLKTIQTVPEVINIKGVAASATGKLYVSYYDRARVGMVYCLDLANDTV